MDLAFLWPSYTIPASEGEQTPHKANLEQRKTEDRRRAGESALHSSINPNVMLQPGMVFVKSIQRQHTWAGD